MMAGRTSPTGRTRLTFHVKHLPEVPQPGLPRMVTSRPIRPAQTSLFHVKRGLRYLRLRPPPARPS
jgi:hypothetical protein